MEAIATLPALKLPSGHYFPFYPPKATEVAASFLAHAGGCLPIRKLVQLIYLLDRLSFERRGHPVLGGSYVSLKDGPGTSELLARIIAGRLASGDDDSWALHFDYSQHDEICLHTAPTQDYVSEGEVKWITEIWHTHGHRDESQLSEWCRANCGEWEPGSVGSPIGLAAIGRALGKADSDVAWTRQEAQSEAWLGALLS